MIDKKLKAIESLFGIASDNHIKEHGSMRGVFCGDIKGAIGRKKSYGLTKERAYHISMNTRNAYIEAFK